MFLYLMVVMVIIVYYMDMKMFENDLMFVILVQKINVVKNIILR